MTEPTSLQATREQTIDSLCRRFADDTLTMPELERRLDRARSARTRQELRTLLDDLPAPSAVPARAAAGRSAPAAPGRPAGAARPGRSTSPSPRSGGGVRTSSQLALAVLGGTRRAGRWAPPASMTAMAIMGGVELDFREATLEPGVTSINCFAFWGGIDITVPPDVYVETNGFALMGGFDQSADTDADPPPDARIIRVNGLALMGGVDVKVRRRGER